MLLQKSYATGDILCFKILNGDEIVARLVEESTDKFTISRPCTVFPSNQGLGLVQSLFSGDINTNIVLSKTHVMMHSPVVKDIENHYIKTTTGIEPVSKGIIT
jgi:hypothetical protein